MDWTGISVGLMAAAMMAAAVGAGAWVALNWPEAGLRRTVQAYPVASAGFVVGAFLLAVAVLTLATVPWGS